MNRGSPADSNLPPVIDVEIVARDGGNPLTPDELAELRWARHLLSRPGVAIRLANIVGAPIEKGLRLLPPSAARVVHRATRLALSHALRIAVHSLPDTPVPTPRNRFHRWLVGASGAVGGAFGLGALAVELPVSTTLILRSIAQIAASQGHRLSALETRLACLEVFALGGDTTADNAAETSYWAVRAALGRLVTEAASSLAGRAASLDATPAAVRLVAAVSARFGLVVSEQVAAKAVPVVGAAAGAAINVAFMNHFQLMAEGHFIVRRLERQYGTETVRQAYESLSQSSDS
ncbi:MAG: EcsC family protein [Verrucomicrobiae bacterium]|nr:EcsC family protein [Verrucomicrobiae bacterium]